MPNPCTHSTYLQTTWRTVLCLHLASPLLNIDCCCFCLLQESPSSFAAPGWEGTAQPVLDRDSFVAALSMLHGQHLYNMLKNAETICMQLQQQALQNVLVRTLEKPPGKPSASRQNGYLPKGRSYFQCNPDDQCTRSVADGGQSPGIVALEDSIHEAVKASKMAPSNKLGVAASLAEGCRQQL